MPKVINTIKKIKKNWEDIYKHYKNCMANVFLLHLMILLQNVNITMLIYAEGKGSFLKIKKWVDCGIVSIGQLLGPNGYFTYNEFKTKVQTINTDYLLYEGILATIKDYHKKFSLELKGSFVVTLWKCLLKMAQKVYIHFLLRIGIYTQIFK